MLSQSSLHTALRPFFIHEFYFLKNILYLCTRKCPDGGIGRRAGLKHQWSNIHPGSTPGLGTTNPL